jgi:hypothetical protein
LGSAAVSTSADPVVNGKNATLYNATLAAAAVVAAGSNATVLMSTTAPYMEQIRQSFARVATPALLPGGVGAVTMAASGRAWDGGVEVFITAKLSSQLELRNLQSFYAQTCSCRALVLELNEHASGIGDDASWSFFRTAITECSLVLKEAGDGIGAVGHSACPAGKSHVGAWHGSVAVASLPPLSPNVTIEAKRKWKFGDPLPYKDDIMGDTSDFIILIICLGLSFFMILALQCGFIKIGRRKRDGGAGGDYDEMEGEECEDGDMEAGGGAADAGGGGAAGGIASDPMMSPFGFDAEFEQWYHGAFNNNNKADKAARLIMSSG